MPWYEPYVFIQILFNTQLQVKIKMNNICPGMSHNFNVITFQY